VTARDVLSVALGIGSGLNLRWYAAALLPALLGWTIAKGLRTYANAIDLYAGDE
jgi:hypothetical protein